MAGAELAALIDEAGEPKVGAPLGQLLTAQAMRDPARPALTVEGITTSRAELERAANRRARWFAGMGVAQDDVIAIVLPNGREHYETVLAAWKLGAIPAPISNKLTDGEFAAILGLGEPRLVVGRRVPGFRSIDAGLVPDPDLSDEPLAVRTAASWKMATSGGSTGAPKLVVDAAPGVWGEEKIALGRHAGATIINPAPLYHSAPFGLVIPGLLQGCHVIEMGRFDAEGWLSLVDRHRVEWAYMVPTMMARIARLPDNVRARYDISSLRTLLHLAAPCPEWVKRFWIDWIGPEAIWEIYGGAERLGATLISGMEWLAHPGSVGKPGKNTRLQIRGEDGRELPVGEVGEIYLRRAKPASALRTAHGDVPQGGEWATFGDLGRVDEEGYLYIVDRRTDMIVSGGANLYPSEIEAALSSHPNVVGAVVVGLPHADLGRYPHAVVQCAQDDLEIVSEADLRRHLGGVLAITKHPRSFEFTTRSLRDDAGKVRRSAWRDEILAREQLHGMPASDQTSGG